jgi:hypothetical protein
MAPYMIAFVILLVVLFAMVIINTNKITKLQSDWKSRVDPTIPQSESLIMRAPSGTLVPKTPYYVAPLKPAGGARADPVDNDGKVTAQLVYLNYDTGRTDVARLKSDIDNKRISYVFRADKRTLYEITYTDDKAKLVTELVGGTAAQAQTLVFAVKGIDGVTLPFIAGNEYPTAGGTATQNQSYDMTIIGIPRYNAKA